MIDAVVRAAAPRLPLRVLGAEWSDPVLLLHGDGWSLMVASPWRIVEGGRLRRGCWDHDAAREVATLVGRDVVGRDVVGIEPQGGAVRLDPALVLSDGRRLEVFPVDDVEPWVLRLPSGPVWVPVPSRPEALADLATGLPHPHAGREVRR
jgi:hypothetical protein